MIKYLGRMIYSDKRFPGLWTGVHHVNSMLKTMQIGPLLDLVPVVTKFLILLLGFSMSVSVNSTAQNRRARERAGTVSAKATAHT